MCSSLARRERAHRCIFRPSESQLYTNRDRESIFEKRRKPRLKMAPDPRQKKTKLFNENETET